MNRPEPQTTEQDEETPVPHEPPPRKAPDLERGVHAAVHMTGTVE